MRVKTIQTGNKELVVVDCSNIFSDTELYETLNDGNKMIASKPEKSVHLITNLSGSKVNGEVGAAFKQYAANNTPYIKEAAVVGLDNMHKLIFSVIKTLARRNIQLCATMEEAVQYMESVS